MQPSGKPEHVRPSIALYFSDRPPTVPQFVLRVGDAPLDIAPVHVAVPGRARFRIARLRRDPRLKYALEAGLAVYKGRPLVNSVTGEEERLERVLPLIKKYDAAVIAISNDETGISEDPDVRYAVAKKIVERAQDHGIKRQDVVVDPLVMPVGAINDAGAKLTYLLRRLREELKVNTSCGASNFSFGLPNRRGLGAAFLPMMIGAGLTSAIMNPLHEEDRQAILGADVVMGHDPNCAAWIRKYREPPPEGGEAAGEGRGRREGRRRARE